MIRTRIPKERFGRIGMALRPLGILVSLFATTPSIAQPGDNMANAQITREEKEILDFNPSQLRTIYQSIQEGTLKQNDASDYLKFLGNIQTILGRGAKTPGEMQIHEKFGGYKQQLALVQGALLTYQQPVGTATARPEERWEGDVVPVKLAPVQIDVPVPNYEIFTGVEENTYVATNPDAGEELVSLYRAPGVTEGQQRELATNATIQYIQAQRQYLETGAEGVDAELAAKGLASSLKLIPERNNIWQNPDFADAVKRLEEGDLSAIESLNAIPELTNFLNTVVNSYAFIVDERSFKVFTTTATVEFAINEENQKLWKKYLKEEGTLSPRFLGMFLSATYSLLEPRGQLVKLVRENGELKEEVVKDVVGEGHSIGGTVGGTVTGVTRVGETEIPYMIRISTEIGFHTSKFKYDVEKPGGRLEQKEVTIEQAYLGAHGIEFQFPGKEGKRGIFGYVERMGAYHISTDFASNYLFYVSTSVTPIESGSFRLSFQATPQINWLFNQLKLGTSGDVIAEFFNKTGNRFAGKVGADYKRNFATDTDEVTLRLGIDIGLTESFTAGVTAEKGLGEGYEEYSAKASKGWTGGLNLKFTF